VLTIDYPASSTERVLHVRTFTKKEYDILYSSADPSRLLTFGGADPGAPPTVFRVNYQVATQTQRD